MIKENALNARINLKPFIILSCIKNLSKPIIILRLIKLFNYVWLAPWILEKVH